MTHESHRHHKWPQFTTIIKESSQIHHTLVQVFHAIPRRTSVGSLHIIPMSFVKYGGVLSNSKTVEATKFVRPLKSHMC
jgi:hypothetical protein